MSIQTGTLDDLMALNDQLAALAAAGVPVDMGGREADLPRTLEKVNSLIARRVSRQATLQQALEDEAMVPDWYRCLVLVGLRSGDLDAALAASNQLANSVEESRQDIAASFFYPIVVCLLAYLGMIGFCLFFLPTIERTYDTFRVEPGIGLSALQIARATLPFWVSVPPILLLIGAWRARRQPFGVSRILARIFGRSTGMSKSIDEARWATFASTMAILDRGGVPLAEAIPLAACATGSSQIAMAGDALATEVEADQFTLGDRAAAQSFPPFLRWALLNADSTISRVGALEMAAQVYQTAAERRATRSRVVVPMIVVAIVGGGVTLLYALAVFLPVVEMLLGLAA